MIVSFQIVLVSCEDDETKRDKKKASRTIEIGLVVLFFSLIVISNDNDIDRSEKNTLNKHNV